MSWAIGVLSTFNLNSAKQHANLSATGRRLEQLETDSD
jgi:hypothetical protein